MNMKQSKWMKIIALFIVLTMVLGLLATGFVLALFSGDGIDVVGTYSLADGSKLELDKDSIATITVPGQPNSAQTGYSVQGDRVTLENPETGEALVTFRYRDGTLRDTSGQTSDVWRKE